MTIFEYRLARQAENEHYCEYLATLNEENKLF